MAKKKSKPFRIESNGPAEPRAIVAKTIPSEPDNKIGVNLRYFQKSHECFSAWIKEDLKAFSGWIEKMAARTESQITSTTKTCHAHKGKTKSLPPEVSPEVKMYGLDVGAKARVHGFFVGSQFYLVWLDRTHAIFKS